MKIGNYYTAILGVLLLVLFGCTKSDQYSAKDILSEHLTQGQWNIFVVEGDPAMNSSLCQLNLNFISSKSVHLSNSKIVSGVWGLYFATEIVYYDDWEKEVPDFSDELFVDDDDVEELFLFLFFQTENHREINRRWKVKGYDANSVTLERDDVKIKLLREDE